MSFWKNIFRTKEKPQVATIKEGKIQDEQEIEQVKKSINKQYLLGYEVVFDGEEHCNDFIATQISSEFNANNVYAAIELVFENSKLIEAYNIRDGRREIRKLSDEEIGLEYREYPINPILKMFDNPEGQHQLGGELPEDVKFPENDCVVPFQYLGYISDLDENLNWLPSTIHLMCPIYLNIDKVYLDYSDANKPVLINRNEVESIDTSYDDLNRKSEIIFNSRRFDLIPFDDYEPPLHSGVPSWIQYPTFPKCPKTGKRMRFLCQINEGVTAKNSNVIPKNEYYRNYYEKLNYWGDGDLFVFIEPVEKTVCYFIQNT